MSILISSSLIALAICQSGPMMPSLPSPPLMPAAFPSVDQTMMIIGAFLTDPVIVQAINYVKAVVPAAALAIAPSTYNAGKPAAPTYTANADANCYWPTSLCTRNNDTTLYKADITVCPNANDWGLTYDDGPIVDPAGKAGTAQLLVKLASANIKSTLFIVGANAVQFPYVVASANSAGHQLALHTWTHHPLTSLTNEQIVAELKYNEAIIYNATGKVPIYFRPPYGDVDDRVRAIVSALGYRTVYWTTTPNRDSADAEQTVKSTATAATVLTAVKSWFVAQAGFISLQHDIDPYTNQVGIDILSAITAAGPSFPLKPQPVGQCQGLTPAQWYKGVANSTTVMPSATASSPITSSTAKVPAGSSQSSASTTSLSCASILLAILSLAITNLS